MTELVTLFNAEREAQGRPPIRIGIGIASGEMIAGYAGTKQRATYTCIGDIVNLAARIEQHTKVAQHAILVDAATREALGDTRRGRSPGPGVVQGNERAATRIRRRLLKRQARPGVR